MARNPAVLVSLLADWDGKDLAKAQREIAKMQAQTKTFGDKFAAMGKKIQDVGASVSKVGGSLTKSLTLPLVGIGAAATATAIEFESSMSKITGLVGIAADEVKDMETAVLDLAGKTAKAPNELADALFVVTSAGLRGSDALETLESAAKAGAAGLGETDDIARSVSGALSAYGTDVLSAAEATDMIVATARAGNFETSQFAGALGRVLINANSAGAGLDQVGGGVALLTRINTDAAQSVTMMNALFKAFVSPTREASKMLGEMGMSAEDVRNKIEKDGLPAALNMLNDALGGNREELGRLLGSSEAQGAAFAILDSDAQTLADTFGLVGNATGMTDEAFGVVAETTQFKLNQALTELKASLIEIGAIILPFVNQIVERFGVLTDAFRGLTPAQQEMIVKFGAIAAAVGPVLLVVGKLITGVGAIIAVFNPLTLKIALVVAAIAALVAAFMYAWNNSKELRDTVQDAFRQIRETVTDVIDRVRQVLEDNRDELMQVRDAFQTVAQFVIDKVVPVLVKLYSFYLKNVIKFLGYVVEGLIEVIAYWVNFISKMVEVGAAISSFVTTAISNISSFLSNMQESFRNAFNAVAGFVTGIFRGVYDTITGTVRDAVNVVIGQINRIVNSWNALSFTIPSFTVGIPPAVKTFGPFGIGTPNLPTIPALAEGGIVQAATLAVIGEAGPEAVVPLDRGGRVMGLGTTINLTVTAGLGTDGSEVGRQIVEALSAYERRNGKVYANA